MLTVQVSPRYPPGPVAPTVNAAPALEQIVERVRQTPGVVHAAVISGGMPLGGSMSTTAMTVPGRKVDDPNGISIRRVTPDYHRALRIPLKADGCSKRRTGGVAKRRPHQRARREEILPR